MKLYKVLGDNHSCSGGNFNWTPYLPTDGKPGEWTPKKRSVSMCKSGYHGTTAEHLLYFMDGNQLWEVETEGITWDDEHQKFVARRMRLIRQIETWNDKTLRLFACWCARQVWDLLPDERSRNAVEVAERYANGEATNEELSAARDAARDAAWAAARDAARDAARAAAWDAARDEARDAAWDAAWAAARAAAWAAARDAAWAAAWDAARDAAWAAQVKYLIEILGISEEVQA